MDHSSVHPGKLKYFRYVEYKQRNSWCDIDHRPICSNIQSRFSRRVGIGFTICHLYWGSAALFACLLIMKTLALISEIIMRKCRIVLRRAVAADAKDINRRKLINGIDDEGILESPYMVSRPLDFKIIDLRLAYGVYGGSHDAFLEDVRELWNNRRITHTDQPNLVELADKLSTNFESLYEDEVRKSVDEKFIS